MKAWRSLENFELREHGVRAWLLTILRNTWRDALRSRNRHGTQTSLSDLIEDPAAPELPEMPAANPQSAADADALLNSFSDQRIIDALHSLGDEFRWTVLLVDVSDLSYEEAAVVLGIPVGTVRSRLFRGRAMLHETLRDVTPGLQTRAD